MYQYSKGQWVPRVNMKMQWYGTTRVKIVHDDVYELKYECPGRQQLFRDVCALYMS